MEELECFECGRTFLPHEGWSGYDHGLDRYISICFECSKRITKARQETQEKEREAVKKALDLLSFKENEIAFVYKTVEKDDDSYNYITLNKRIPRDLYEKIKAAGGVRAFFDEELKKWFYKFNEEKATPVLSSAGYKVVSLAEWKARQEEAQRILKEAQVPQWKIWEILEVC